MVELVGRTYEEKLAESGLATLKDRWIDLIDRFSSYFLNPHRIWQGWPLNMVQYCWRKCYQTNQEYCIWVQSFIESIKYRTAEKLLFKLSNNGLECVKIFKTGLTGLEKITFLMCAMTQCNGWMNDTFQDEDKMNTVPSNTKPKSALWTLEFSVDHSLSIPSVPHRI